MEREAGFELGPGSEVAGYRIEVQIGQGGMSRVYRARDLRLGRPVALKLLGPDLASDPIFTTRFEREWRLAASLRHPHIVPIYTAGEDAGILYIAMLLVEGGDLSSTLRRTGAMEPTRALDLLAQVASALNAAHRQHLIHRDLKPSNVLLETGAAADGGDHAYLADFGLTKSVSNATHLTRTGLYVGTPNYSAPEQIEGRPVDSRADLYALGCMLFECLTGSVPFPREHELAVMAAHLTESPPSAVDRRPGLPAAIDAVVARALAKRPDARYATATELIAAARAAVRPARAAPTTFIPPVEGLVVGQAQGRAEPPPEVQAARRAELRELISTRRAEAREQPAAAAWTPAPAVASAPTQLQPAPPRSPEGRGLPTEHRSSHAASATARPATGATRIDRRPPALPHRRRRSSRGPLRSLAAIAVIPFLVGGALLSGVLPGGLFGSAGIGGATGSPGATTPASSRHYFPGATPDERFLLDAVPAAVVGDCRRGEQRSTDLDVEGDVAAIDCPVEDPNVSEVRYFRFVSAEELRSWWTKRLRAASLQPDSGGCAGGRHGETAYDQGRVLCYLSAGQARLRWTDEARLIYGVVNTRTAEIDPVVAWWTATHHIGGLRPEAAFNSVEQTLVDEAPADVRGTCIPYRVVAEQETPVEGSTGAIDCIVNTSLVEDVGYFELPTGSALRAWWDKRVARLPVEPGSGGCVGGTTGETSTPSGRIACYVTGGFARIRWTDEARLVYGTLNGRTTDQAALFAWWDAHH